MKKEEKYLSIFLVFFGLSALILGMFSIKSSITGAPLQRVQLNQDGTDQILSQTDSTAEDELKGKDTDKDGLNDYEELNVYFTSPYLEDSDSDGVNDKEEINTGEDPSCPKGQNCFRQDIPQPGGTDSSGTELDLNPLGQSGLGSLYNQGTSGLDLRAILRSAGMSEAELSQLSDEELSQLYNAALLQYQGLGEESLPSPTLDPAGIGTVDPYNLTATQLRELLKQAGATDAILNQYDDATLLKKFRESLGQ